MGMPITAEAAEHQDDIDHWALYAQALTIEAERKQEEITVQGVPKSLWDVSDEDQARMTDSEYENYYAMGMAVDAFE
jgi:hypothetical protein